MLGYIVIGHGGLVPIMQFCMTAISLLYQKRLGLGFASVPTD